MMSQQNLIISELNFSCAVFGGKVNELSFLGWRTISPLCDALLRLRLGHGRFNLDLGTDLFITLNEMKRLFLLPVIITDS